MPTVDVLNQTGQVVSSLELTPEVFDVPFNRHVVTETIVTELSNKRQGTAKAKDRGEVSGGGKKLWRQKGTGRARMGSSRSPIWRHGGVTHGPLPKVYDTRINKKVRRLAYRALLSDRLRSGALVVLDGFKLPEAKTKRMIEILSKIGKSEGKGAFASHLIVTAESEQPVWRSARNIPNVLVRPSNNLSIAELAKAERVIFTVDSIRKVQEVLGK